MTGEGAPRWTLITVTYNSRADLVTYWADGVPAGVEWVVVDNNSADASAATAEALGARVVALPENVGFSAANNVGLARAQGSYVAFVNPDVRPDFGALDRLQSSVDESGGLVAPQLLNPDGTRQPNGRGLPTPWAKLANRLRQTEGPDSYRIYADPDDVLPVSWCMGAVVAASRETFRRLGGWDERYFVYYEDSDICLRAWKADVPVMLDGGVTWVHGWARETNSWNRSAWTHEARSALTFYRRYPGLALGAKLGRLLHAGPRNAARRAVGQPVGDHQGAASCV